MKCKFALVCWMIFGAAVFASQEISLKQLFDQSSSYNGQKVTITGEVIGDMMSEGSGFWINMKDGDFLIGVFIRDSEREKIKYLGRYRVKGDIVKVNGIYNEHCVRHSGENDIHAENIDIVKQGELLEEEIDAGKAVISFILGIITIIFLIYSHRNKNRQDTSGEP